MLCSPCVSHGVEYPLALMRIGSCTSCTRLSPPVSSSFASGLTVLGSGVASRQALRPNKGPEALDGVSCVGRQSQHRRFLPAGSRRRRILPRPGFVWVPGKPRESPGYHWESLNVIGNHSRAGFEHCFGCPLLPASLRSGPGVARIAPSVKVSEGEEKLPPLAWRSSRNFASLNLAGTNERLLENRWLARPFSSPKGATRCWQSGRIGSAPAFALARQRTYFTLKV